VAEAEAEAEALSVADGGGVWA